ncbi:hypothetical protein EMPS_06623 [Entomortierella parvispora]|uniref:F-box domain-containing protein n=1 Tax=Entomortierella parvispora TaxID=205924 RepID=A0A9P3HCN0_9FUNG|nr:hypothetical protein EMPS_06623 [Entomortierella parvispora]
MMDTIIHPLDLPEIRLVLADILSLHTLTVCARVNKEWYRSFMPPVWRHTSLQAEAERTGASSARAPTLELAIKHREVIQGLAIRDLNEWRVRQRRELWAAISGFPVLRSLAFQQTSTTQTVVKPETIQLLKPRFLHLTAVDFHPNINLASESYEEIMSSCPQLLTLRGGNVKALVLTQGRPWACTMLRLWSLCLDFGTTDDYRRRIADSATGPLDSATGPLDSATGPSDSAIGPSDSETSSSMEKVVEQQIEQMRKEARRQLFERISLLVHLESADFRQVNPIGCSGPLLQLDRHESSLELLLQCPRLKEVMFDWDKSELETYDWIKTHWQQIKVNSPPTWHDDYDEDEDEDEDGYGSNDSDFNLSPAYEYRTSRYHHWSDDYSLDDDYYSEDDYYWNS